MRAVKTVAHDTVVTTHIYTFLPLLRNLGLYVLLAYFPRRYMCIGSRLLRKIECIENVKSCVNLH